jgi:hypothetical protein
MKSSRIYPVTVSFYGAGRNLWELREKKELVEEDGKTYQRTVLNEEGKPVMKRVLNHIRCRCSITRNFSHEQLWKKEKKLPHGVSYPNNATPEQIMETNLLEIYLHDIPEVRSGKGVTITVEAPI